jgi:hypothetical protein
MLEAALNVLRVEKADLNRPALSTRNLERFIRYDLRARGPKECPTTWVDQDLSEDFQPDEERRHQASRRVAKRKVLPEPGKADGNPRKLAKTRTGGSSIQSGLSAQTCPVTPKFETPPAELFLDDAYRPRDGPSHANVDRGNITNGIDQQSSGDMSTPPPSMFEGKYCLRSSCKVGEGTR